MKKIQLVIAGIFIAQNLGAQSPLSERIIESWDAQGETWEDSAKIEFSHFYNGDSLVGLISDADGNGGWIEQGAEIKVEINGRRYLDAEMDYNAGESKLVNNYEKVYKYGALVVGGSPRFYLSEIVERRWNESSSQWDTIFIHRIDADVFNTRTNILYMVDGSNGDTLYRLRHTYDFSGRIVEINKDSLDQIPHDWIAVWKKTHIYTTGMLTGVDVEYESDGRVERTEYFFDNHVNNTRILYSEAPSASGTFTGNYVVDFEYNEFNQVTTELHRYINNTDTINHKRVNASYGSTTVRDIESKVFYSLMPNPCNDQLRISSKYPLNRVVIYDHMGKACCEWTVDETDVNLNVELLKPGAYILRAVGPDLDHHSRFMIER